MDQCFSTNAVLSLFSKNYMELKKDLPIRPSEMGVLNILAATPGPHTSVLLAELLGVSKPMITAHLTALAEKGYITRARSEEDRRVYFILPTEKARTLVEQASVDMARQLSALAKEMGQEDFDTFVRLAQKANQILEENKQIHTPKASDEGGTHYGSR